MIPYILLIFISPSIVEKTYSKIVDTGNSCHFGSLFIAFRTSSPNSFSFRNICNPSSYLIGKKLLFVLHSKWIKCPISSLVFKSIFSLIKVFRSCLTNWSLRIFSLYSSRPFSYRNPEIRHSTSSVRSTPPQCIRRCIDF